LLCNLVQPRMKITLIFNLLSMGYVKMVLHMGAGGVLLGRVVLSPVCRASPSSPSPNTPYFGKSANFGTKPIKSHTEGSLK